MRMIPMHCFFTIPLKQLTLAYREGVLPFIHRAAEKGYSRKVGFRYSTFSDTRSGYKDAGEGWSCAGEATTTSVGSRPSLTSSRKGVQMNPQMLARVTGVLFLSTSITSIPARP